MREIRTSGLMSEEGKRACANGSSTAPLLDSTDQWPQATYPRRYARPLAERQRSTRRCAGSRRRSRPAPYGTALVPLRRAYFRRCRLSGTKDGQGRRRHRLLDLADRQTQRRAPLRRSAQAMDRRAHIRLDQPQPPPGARLRTLRRNRRRLRPPRNDPHHAQTLDQTKPLLMNPFFLDRLLDAVDAHATP